MINPCHDIVRQHDRDRYLATLYLPQQHREPVMALLAFSCEISRIRYVVSEPQMGEIRLQWWRDTISSFAPGEMAPGHPVADALRETVITHNLPQAPLQALIDAHQFDLYADQMPSRTDLEGYLGETCSATFQLAAMIVSPAEAASAADICGYAGLCYGLTHLLRETNANTKFVPPGETVGTMKEMALDALREVRAWQPSGNLFTICLPLAAAEVNLQASRGEASPLRRQWSIWRSARREKL